MIRVALVHERLTEIAGSENVVAELARQWPDAPITIPIVDPRVRAPFADRVRTGALSAAYRATGCRSYAPLLPAVPGWLRRQDFSDADVVVVSHHAFAIAAVAAAPAIPTVAYVHSPARWAWDRSMRADEADSWAGRRALDALSRVAINTERAAAPRITTIVANSHAVAQRIAQRWGREAQVVHPPVDIDFYTPATEAREDYFLLPGRLVPYKRPDIAIRAAVRAGVPLVVAGDGREAAKCRSLADGGDVTFLGRVSDEELRTLYRRAKATLMPGEEDFGITPVEAMACGTPVIALGVGGAKDSVVENVTGSFINGADDEEVVRNFADTLAAFDGTRFDPTAIGRHAQTFSREAFRRNMADVVTRTVEHANP